MKSLIKYAYKYWKSYAKAKLILQHSTLIYAFKCAPTSSHIHLQMLHPSNCSGASNEIRQLTVAQRTKIIPMYEAYYLTLQYWYK